MFDHVAVFLLIQEAEKNDNSEQSDMERNRSEIYHVYDQNQAQLAHEDQNMWFVKCTRNEAEQLLKDNRKEGTFLIRPRNQVDSYALSIV